MTKNKLLPIFSFILLFGFAVNINAEESESLENYKLTGKLIRKPRSWSLDLLYNEKEIKGEFYNRAAINLPVNTYKTGITIGKKKYKGNILKKMPLFGKDFYEIDMSCNKVPLEGEINKSFRKVYRKDEIELEFGDLDLIGSIIYERKGGKKIFLITYGDKRITGKTHESRKLRTRFFDFKFQDKSFAGQIKSEIGYDTYYFQGKELLDDDELFIFLLLEIYRTIDEFEAETKESSSDD